LDYGTVCFELRDAFEETLIKSSISTELQEGMFRVNIWKNSGGPELFTVLQAYTFGPSIMDKDSGNRAIGANDCPVGFSGCRQSKTNAPHTATYIAPHAVHSIDLAKHMVPGDIDRTGCFRADKGTYHTLSCPSSAKIVRFKVVG